MKKRKGRRSSSRSSLLPIKTKTQAKKLTHFPLLKEQHHRYENDTLFLRYIKTMRACTCNTRRWEAKNSPFFEEVSSSVPFRVLRTKGFITSFVPGRQKKKMLGLAFQRADPFLFQGKVSEVKIFLENGTERVTGTSFPVSSIRLTVRPPQAKTCG